MNSRALLALGEILLFSVEKIADFVDSIGGDDLDDYESLDALQRLKTRSDAAGARIQQAVEDRDLDL